MDEALTALEFYKEIVQALRATGIRKIIVTLSPDGHLDANIYHPKKCPCGNKGK